MEFKEQISPRYTLNGHELEPNTKERPPINFDPTQTVISPESPCIAEIPGNNKYLLRWTHDRWQKGFGSMEFDIKERLSVARQHHDQLGTFGIGIPDYTHVAVGKDPEHDATAIYTMVKKLNLLAPEDIGGEKYVDLLESMVIPAIKAYEQWVSDTKQPYKLVDLNIEQFGFVLVGEDDQEYTPYLVDIEALVAHNN